MTCLFPLYRKRESPLLHGLSVLPALHDLLDDLRMHFLWAENPCFIFLPLVVAPHSTSSFTCLSLSPQTGGFTAQPVMPRMVSGSIWPRSPPVLHGCSGCSSIVCSTSCGWQCSSCVSSTRFGLTDDTPLLFKSVWSSDSSKRSVFTPIRLPLWESPPMRGWTRGDTSTLKSQQHPSKAPSSKSFIYLLLRAKFYNFDSFHYNKGLIHYSY